MMGRFVVFVAAYVVWFLLILPFRLPGEAAGLDAQGMLLGLVAALLVALLVPAGRDEGAAAKCLSPARWFWALVYVPVLLYQIVVANLQVVYLVLHPEMPIRPGTVKVKTSLRSAAGLTALANSITLTPGTLTVDVAGEEGVLYVHWIAVGAEDDEGATREIVARFEPLLRRIFE